MFLFITKLVHYCIIESTGVGVNLLKVGSKRRRTKTEIESQKEEARIKEAAIDQKIQQFEEMQQQINQMQSHISEADQLRGFFQDMINKGKLVRDDNGNIDVPNQDGGTPSQYSVHSNH